MKTPEWLQPALIGAATGAVVLAVVGFSWGGWMTGSKARDMADDQAHAEVVAALVPVCLEQSKQDPKAAETLAELKGTSSYQRSDLLMKTGWATMPGSEEPDRSVAQACMDKLAAQF